MISEGVLSGSMFLEAQSPAWPIAMSRKSSQASASRCLTFFLPSFSPSSSTNCLLMAAMASWVRIRIGPLPAFMSFIIRWLRMAVPIASTYLPYLASASARYSWFAQ